MCNTDIMLLCYFLIDEYPEIDVVWLEGLIGQKDVEIINYLSYF